MIPCKVEHRFWAIVFVALLLINVDLTDSHMIMPKEGCEETCEVFL